MIIKEIEIMNSRSHILFAFSLVLIVGMTLTPAFGATKGTVTKGKILINDQDVSVCGTIVDLDGVLNHHLMIWDNGQFNLKLALHGILIDDATGKIVGSFSGNSIRQNNVDAIKEMVQVNAKTTCNGSGLTTSVHFGFTVKEDGRIHFHGVLS